MSITKIIIWAAVVCLLSSCDKNRKLVKSVVDFTPKLTQEVSNFSPIVPSKNIEVTSWDGIDFVNQGSNNFALENPSFKFSKTFSCPSGIIVGAPVIANNKMFIISSRNIVTCYDLETKKPIWSVALSMEAKKQYIASGAITLDADRIYVVNNSRHLTILEASSGYEIAKITLTDIVSNPVTVDQDKLYVLMANNTMVSFDKKNLTNIWQLNGTQSSLTLSLQTLIKPIAFDGTIISQFYSGQILGINKTNGDQLWYLSVSSELDFSDMTTANISSQSIIDGHHLFTSSSAGNISKINVQNGQIIWQKELADVLAINKFGNMLVVTTNAQEIVALSEATGQIVWVIDLTSQQKNYKTAFNLLTPFMVNDLIYVISANGLMYEIKPDGSLLNSYPIIKGVAFYSVYKNKIMLIARNRLLTN